MRVQSVNGVLNYNKSSNEYSFKGLVGKSKTEIVSLPHWSQSAACSIGTYHTRTVLTYYNFLEDNIEDLNRVLSENTYVRSISANPDSLTCSQCNTIEEGVVKVKDVPITQRLYNSYLEKELSSRTADFVVKALKKSGLRELVRK